MPNKKQITIFTTYIRPLEDHILGLINICELEKDFKINLFIDKNSKLFRKIKNLKSLPKNIHIVTHKNILKIFDSCLRSCLIFGRPKSFGYILLLLSQLINKNSTRIGLIPGNVLKAVGHFKKNKNNFFPFLRILIMNKFFRVRILTPTPEVKLYLSAAWSFPINIGIDYPLPKHIFLKKKLQSNINKKDTILFSPTHRWDKVISPLEKLLSDDNFIESLIKKGFKIKYTYHPHYSLQSSLNSKVTLFNGEWENVKALVTDYSSIGYDYFYSGGENLIYYTPDINEFEKHEGKGPLFLKHLKMHTNIVTVDDLLYNLSNLESRQNINKKEFFINNEINKNYFSELLKKINYLKQ